MQRPREERDWAGVRGAAWTAEGAEWGRVCECPRGREQKMCSTDLKSVRLPAPLVG